MLILLCAQTLECRYQLWSFIVELVERGLETVAGLFGNGLKLVESGHGDHNLGVKCLYQ